MRNYHMTPSTDCGGCRMTRSSTAPAVRECRPVPDRSNHCVPETVSLTGDFSLAMAYVPWQCFSNTYEPDHALEVGTIFPELDMPFLAAGRCARV